MADSETLARTLIAPSDSGYSTAVPSPRETKEALKAARGHYVTGAELVTLEERWGWGSYSQLDALVISMTGGRCLVIWNYWQNCCERRYMTCDDDLSGLRGRMLSVEVRDGPAVQDNGFDEDEDEDFVQEVQFLVIRTDRDTATVACHNDHNGYYSGFCIGARMVQTTGRRIEWASDPAWVGRVIGKAGTDG